MRSLRLPRWTSLLVLLLSAGALLFMHGLDAGVSTSPLHGAAVTAPASMHPHHGDATAEHRRMGCARCTAGHVMAACVAVVVTVMGVRAARRVTAMRWSTLLVVAVGRALAVRAQARPPDPVWIRLAVMRC